MPSFPPVKRGKRGYNVAQVDDFLSRAQHAYALSIDERGEFNAQYIRNTAFSLVRKGYDPEAVDIALDRLEDFFAAQERDLKLAQADLYQQDQESMKVLKLEMIARLEHPKRRRFRSAGVLGYGYSRRQVDLFCGHILKYFSGFEPLSVEEVRGVTFRLERGGYKEAQVDFFLDTLIEFILSVR